MLFNSPIFLFFFLPLVILASFAAPKKFKNFILLIASLIFYAWSGISMTFIMIFSIILNYVVGRGIEKNQDKRSAKTILVIGVILNLSLLCIFKYANFFIDNINTILKSIQVPELKQTGIALPIGISFFTFHGLSYITDIYRRKVVAQRNFINHALYITLFPQLIAGPIVRYHDISEQINNRSTNWDKFGSGVERFIIGLAKKMLIANVFAAIADDIFKQNISEIVASTAWVGIISYSVQIYYDFAGYSDMAIGLGRMFGFDFLENFNFPYVATSIQEFWRRWHISLSSWFRDYLYISLGGNRISPRRVYVNLFIVFLCTGFWHGASWSFIFWGLFHGLFIILEKAGLDKILSRLWKPFRHTYTLLVVMIAWVFFRADNFGFAVQYIQKLFFVSGNKNQLGLFLYYLNNEKIICFLVAVLGAAGAFPLLVSKFENTRLFTNTISKLIFQTVSVVFLFALFYLSVAYIAAGSYSPFIYFRF